MATAGGQMIKSVIMRQPDGDAKPFPLYRQKTWL